MPLIIVCDCVASPNVPQPHARRSGAPIHQLHRLWRAMVDKPPAAGCVRAVAAGPGWLRGLPPVRALATGHLCVPARRRVAPGRQYVRAVHFRPGRRAGARRSAIYYFACVIGAALTQLWVAHSLYPEPYATLGASGGIFGLLLFYGMAFPHRQVLLIFPPIPMPAWLFVTLYGVLELSLGVFGSGQGG